MSSSSTSPPPLLILLLILAYLCVIAFSDNKDECRKEFSKLKNQRNITMCKTLRTLGAHFAWSYRNGTNNSTFIVDVLFGAVLDTNQSTGWLAWGVNPGKRPEMIGTKAFIGVIQTNGSLKVNTYEITKETRIGCHPLPSPLEGVRVLGKSVDYDASSGFLTIYACLELHTPEYNVLRLNHVWQIGYALHPGSDDPQSHPTALHNVDSTETIDLTSGSGRSVGQYRSFLRAVHGVLNIVGWGTLLPIGVIVARYMRVYPCPTRNLWFCLHLVSQSLGYLIGTAGWAIGLWLGQASRYYTFQTHRIFAIFIFTFTTIQMLALRLRPKANDEYRKYWNMYHHFLGYALLVTIFLNIFKGISILKGGEEWRRAYVGILSLLGAITLGFELYTWGKFIYQKRNKQNKFKERDPEKKAESENDGDGGGGGGKTAQ